MASLPRPMSTSTPPPLGGFAQYKFSAPVPSHRPKPAVEVLCTVPLDPEESLTAWRPERKPRGRGSRRSLWVNRLALNVTPSASNSLPFPLPSDIFPTMRAGSFKVGLVQMRCTGDPSRNLDAAEDGIR